MNLPKNVKTIESLIFYDESLMELIGNSQQLFLAIKIDEDQWLISAPRTSDLKDAITGVIGTIDLFLKSLNNQVYYGIKHFDEFIFSKSVDVSTVPKQDLPLTSAKMPQPSNETMQLIEKKLETEVEDNLIEGNRDVFEFKLTEQGNEIRLNDLSDILAMTQSIINSVSKKLFDSLRPLYVARVGPGSIEITMKQEQFNNVLEESELYFIADHLIESVYWCKLRNDLF